MIMELYEIISSLLDKAFLEIDSKKLSPCPTLLSLENQSHLDPLEK